MSDYRENLAVLTGIPEHVFRPKLLSLQEVADHLKPKGPDFISGLEEFGATLFQLQGENSGWETVFPSPKAPQFPGRGIFTGKNLCVAASRAIEASLLHLIDPHRLTVRVVDLKTNMKGEVWTADSPVKNDSPHSMVEVREEETGGLLYIDATYGQINQYFAGQLMLVQPEELGVYYRNTQGKIELLPRTRSNDFVSGSPKLAKTFRAMIEALL